MRKWIVAVSAILVMGGLVVGCGTPMGEKSVANKLETHVKTLDQSNYKSTATMTVQMDNGSQTYTVETWYESPDVYRIALGDANKQVHQIIVHNDQGMFIVSPSLGKVFRFNGSWAQNQGHIYLYNQLLQQIIDGKDVQFSRSSGQYNFELPVTPASDVVARERIQLEAKTLKPQMVTLLDKQLKPVVTLKYTSFQTGVKFSTSDFNPQSIVANNGTVKTTMAEGNPDSLASTSPFGYIEPTAEFGDKLADMWQTSETDTILRFTGNHPFTLEEWRPTSGVSGIPDGELLNLYGVPAVYVDGGTAHQLLWTKDGVEFSLTSSTLSMDEMEDVAMSTFYQVGK
ncbi:MAG: outer membrane lipoprotein carrier protein LolA [Alicyclobacillaceae bacterium]|uniref:outer membrane lipoprotein-sorting protein n=1 Tax=Alicyclobacillus sp. SP_1 TaxID=2942475 RepID=UPI0021579FED|nr:outer membrane lipoprotein carrier protein LolA [Alicyclobacillus sp. SP_1]MCY0887909.1 outer membrane lipoprotein carrier protein LolA [Alicyclobacillaceae bacterium]